MAGNSKEHGRGVTSKATALLDAFLPRSGELSLGELSRRSGLPMSTTYRLANQLVEWGGLERAPGGGYQLGLRLWEIGALARGNLSPVELIRPYMQDLYDVVHENVQLAVLDGDDVVYLEKLSGRASTPVRSRGGGRLPVHATGVGKVLLAWADPHMLERLMPTTLPRYTPTTITNRDELLASLATVREEGVAYAREELTVGVTSVAVPVRDAEGQVIAAISLAVRTPRLKPHHGVAVRTAAAGASRQLRELSVVVRRGSAHRES